MRQVDEFFQEIPESPLFHYTGVDALLGIANSSAIWASHVYYLNDSKEVLHACDVLDRALGNPESHLGLNARDQDFVAQFRTWSASFRRDKYCLFVFSLSEQSSLLSQWRSYTPYGRGVSLGFAPSLIKRLIDKNNLKIAKCVYKQYEQELVLRSLLDKMLTTFRREQPQPNPMANPESTCYYSYLERFRGDVLQVLSIIKHQAFEEEQEWRLVSQYFENYTVPEISFRAGASMLVPYIKLKIGDERPAFERVILGPSAHADLSMTALSMFLSNSRLSNVTENSWIPYREW